MQNFLPDRDATLDIERFMQRILRDLGNPEPPLRLEMVRELLRLDKAFYTSEDDGAVREITHRLKLAGKQILARPMLLREAIAKWNLRALWLPDSKRILIDSTLAQPKQRWSEAHEIGHAIIPWHSATLLGDDQSTLTPQCHAAIEAEANYAAGQLLFFADRFPKEARDLSLEIASIRKLHKRYGNTLTTTLWRYVEQSDEIMVGAIGPHPCRLPGDFHLDHPLRYMIPSAAFARQFTSVSELEVFRKTQEYCHNRRGGPLREAKVILRDHNRHPHLFRFETFYNGHDALTLGVYAGPARVRMAASGR